MGWIKLDDGFLRNPKIMSVGRDAKFLYVAGLCYSGGAQSFGLVPFHQVHNIAAQVGISRPVNVVAQLVDAGLWVVEELGYVIDDDLWRPVIERHRPPAHEWRVIRETVFRRDDYTCQYCGIRGVRLECDHIIPVSRGGNHEPGNLTTACFTCNRSKRDRLVEEWLA